MWAVLMVGLLTGLDNLQAAAGIGMLPLRQARKCHIALAFALFEAGMPLIGLLIGNHLLAVLGHFSAWVAPICLASCGLLIVGLALRERTREASIVSNSRWVLFGLPLSLSYDNLLAGVGIGSLGLPLLPSALIIGGISGTMSLLGIIVGARIRMTVSEKLPNQIELVSGAWLVVAALLTIYLGS